MAVGRMAVLIVSEDEAFGRTFERLLTDAQLNARVVVTIARAVQELDREVPSLVLLDRRFTAALQLRRRSGLQSVPFLSVQPPGQACSEDDCAEDLRHGIDMFACDRSYREALSRLRAILRREAMQSAPRDRYDIGGLSIDVSRHEVTVELRLVDLTPREFQLLACFAASPSRVYTREELLDRIWGEGCAIDEHALDVHIHSIRRKIESDPTRPRYLVTVRGVGFKLRAD